ncbi:fimbrial assembly protein [Burkholderia pseudomallei]|nr:fimbrial assembly protein [Burkholderia pseudomallei]RXS82842.1 fimbrial assembly protein [Burkholderia pseudomallei]
MASRVAQPPRVRRREDGRESRPVRSAPRSRAPMSDAGVADGVYAAHAFARQSWAIRWPAERASDALACPCAHARRHGAFDVARAARCGRRRHTRSRPARGRSPADIARRGPTGRLIANPRPDIASLVFARKSQLLETRPRVVSCTRLHRRARASRRLRGHF